MTQEPVDKTSPSNAWKRWLGVFWSAVSHITAALSLASMTDQLVIWAEFFRELIAYYRLVRDFFLGGVVAALHTCWEYALTFVPKWLAVHLSLPNWTGDYLALGFLLLLGPLIRTIKGTLPRLNAWSKQRSGKSLGQTLLEVVEIDDFATLKEMPLRFHFLLIGYVVVCAAFVIPMFLVSLCLMWAMWPAYLLVSLYFFYFGESRQRPPSFVFWRLVLECLLTPIIFLVFLAINTFVMRFVGIHL